MAAWLLVATATSGCETKRSEARTELSVFAAASLTEAFEALESEFERVHPEIDLQLAFAGSQVLRLQIEQGAPADLFASANEAHMRALQDAGLVDAPRIFARNGLVVIVPDDSQTVRSFADLASAQRIVLGTAQSPVGAYADAVLDAAASELGVDFSTRVREHVVSRETNVRLVRAKVQMGEADAALVYASDAVDTPGLRVVALPASLQIDARYPIARVVASDAKANAERFLDFLDSEAARTTLRARGFESE